MWCVYGYVCMSHEYMACSMLVYHKLLRMCCICVHTVCIGVVVIASS